MKIEELKDGSVYRLIMDGRLDASWCNHLQEVIDGCIRSGEHHLRLDMASVHYLSSAGIRLLLLTFRKLKGIDGSMLIENASPLTENVLKMAGLTQLMAYDDQAAPKASVETVRAHESASAQWEFYSSPDTGGIGVQGIGNPAKLGQGSQDSFNDFRAPALMVGVGALGRDSKGNAQRMGELIAVDGNVAYQPTDGANQPDFMVTHGQYQAEGQLLTGLSTAALPNRLARFEAGASGVINFSELAETILAETKSDAVAFSVVAETAGLVGATLLKSPATSARGDSHFEFPGIRDWLSFSNERVHRDSTCLLVGYVARPGTAIDAWLRPIGQGDLRAHCHAAVFPYHPLRKGKVELPSTVDAMFNDQPLLSVLHLLSDQREIIGAGESQFYRGACWYAPLTF